jgi:hypothetical protein
MTAEPWESAQIARAMTFMAGRVAEEEPFGSFAGDEVELIHKTLPRYLCTAGQRMKMTDAGSTPC